MKRAKGPSRRHSPFSAPGRSSEVLDEFEVAMVVVITITFETVGVNEVGIIWSDVGGNNVGKVVSKIEVVAGNTVDETCWMNDMKAYCGAKDPVRVPALFV